MLKTFFGRGRSSTHRRGRLTAFTAVAALMLFATTLTASAAEARPDTTTQIAAPAGVLDPWVSPNPENSAFGKWTQQQATDWSTTAPPPDSARGSAKASTTPCSSSTTAAPTR